jgi:hypothetical protein
MLFDTAEPLHHPVLLQARLTALMSMLEAQNSAVERLRMERDRFRAERDTANAEVEKLQLLIKQLTRSRYGAHSEKIDPDQLQFGLEEVEQSLGAARAVVEVEPPDYRHRHAAGSLLREGNDGISFCPADPVPSGVWLELKVA